MINYTNNTLCNSILIAIFAFGLTVILSMFQTIEAQRYVDVEPDNFPAEIGSLNRTIENDTERTEDTIYRLQRGATYWTDARIINEGFHLRIHGEEGDGPPPIIRPAVDITGESVQISRPAGPVTWKDVYLSHLDDQGNDNQNPMVVTASNVTVTIDNIFVDWDRQAFIRFNGENNSAFVTNSQMRFSGIAEDPNSGRIFDGRGNAVDTVKFVNNTFYVGTHFAFRLVGATANYVEFNHNTFVDWGEFFELALTKEAKITNNQFINIGWRGKQPNDEDTGLFTFFSAENVPDFNDADRSFIINNNNFAGLHPQTIEVLNKHDREALPLLNSVGEEFLASGILVMENNIQEPEADLGLTERPDLAINNWHDAYLTDPNGPLPPWQDRNQARVDDPIGAVNVDEFRIFSYSETAESFWAGINNFSIGDLNWFPEQKELFEAGGTREVTSNEDVEFLSDRPEEFELQQNFPNPFNPSTQITFTLPSASDVRLDVFNTLGQRVATIVNGQRSAGTHTVSFDASNLSSGMYLYRIQAENFSQVKKMMLIK